MMGGTGSNGAETRQATRAVSRIAKQDAQEAFEAAMAAFKVAAAARKSYPKIESAFRLGWHMAELFQLAEQTPQAADAQKSPPPAGRLPTASDLDPATHRMLLLRQIEIDLEEIETAAEIPPGKLPAAAKLDDAVRADGAAAILSSHAAVLATLTASDFRLGKAYSLGIALADATLRPDGATPVETLADMFSATRVTAITGSLHDLKNTFAADAADAVSSTLSVWQTWLQARTEPLAQPAVDALREQGRIWRGLLSGETPPTELLGRDDYLIAAEEVGKNAIRTARQFARRMWVELAAGIAAFAGIAAALFVFTHGDARGLVAVATILGGLGISWKGIGAALGKSFERVESELWETELAARVAARALKRP
jgi:hypothetical protein